MNTKFAIVSLGFALIFALLGPVSAASPSSGPVLREDDSLVVDGVTEHWRLVWASQPSSFCGPEEIEGKPDWYTCPCSGFAFGEAGDLTLVRSRPGHAAERVPITPIFSDSEIGHGVGGSTKAVLQRWPELDSDNAQIDSPTDDFAKQVTRRKASRAMQFADYDHDGQATEFLLEIDTAPCGKNQMALIGVTKANPRVHLFGTAEHPDKPLYLYRHMWEDLLNSKGDVTVIEWPCGDHGSDKQDEVHLHTDAAGIHATRLTYQCKVSDRGRLESQEVL